MSVTLDRSSRTVLTTSLVPARDAFAYWREMICATFVKLAADPVTDVPTTGFSGRIEHVPVGDIELSTVVAGSQHVRRTRSLIARSDEEYLLASIQVLGTGRVEQDGRVALLGAGEMAFYDSTRPYTLHFDDPFHQLVVQVPKRDLAVADTSRLTARELRTGTPGAVVSSFFTALLDAARASPEQSSLLAPHAVGLLAAAAAFAGRARPDTAALDALSRQRVTAFLREHLGDPGLDADTVARACHVSRRTLYRIVGEGGVAARLRRLRIDRASALLLAARDLPVAAVGLTCGFDSESGFHRAFRAATGQTPGEYRRTRHAG